MTTKRKQPTLPATVAEIERPGGEVLRFTINRYPSSPSGRLRLDVRTWYRPDPGGEYRPTRRGVSIPIDDLDAALAGIKAAVAAFREFGWTPEAEIEAGQAGE